MSNAYVSIQDGNLYRLGFNQNPKTGQRVKGCAGTTGMCMCTAFMGARPPGSKQLIVEACLPFMSKRGSSLLILR